MTSRDEMLQFLLLEAIYSDENRNIPGENISPFPEVKIIFEQYGLDDDDDEDISQECYSIFIHKKSGAKKFNFPPHESSFGLANHREEQEVYFRAWYDGGSNTLSLNDTDEAISDSEVSQDEIDKAIVALYSRYS
jgi:uncharacterized protein YecA (UPF0149 family)